MGDELLFEARLTWLGDCAWLSLSGELDVATAPQAYARLDDACTAAELTIDLRDLCFMDASGLRLLTRASALGPELRVIRGPRCVQRVLELSEIEATLELVDGAPVSC